MTSVKREIEELLGRLTESEQNDLLQSLRERYKREQEELQTAMNAAGRIVEPPNRDEWVNWGRK
jgi:hypothetical protein